MHFYYLDETGCDGRVLINPQQPIFVLGGLILRDEGWNRTFESFTDIISNYFANDIPANFELHAHELLSPNGDGPFQNHPREERNDLALEILNLLTVRSHHFGYVAIDKGRLNGHDAVELNRKDYFDIKVPYLIAYDYLITLYNYYTRNNLGRSARGLVVIDQKDDLIAEIESITSYRRFKGPQNRRIRWLTEFSIPMDSRKNSMIQISDLGLFVIRKFLEIESGYKDNYSTEVKNIFREFYICIHDRLIRRTYLPEEGVAFEDYNNYMNQILSKPTARWRTREY